MIRELPLGQPVRVLREVVNGRNEVWAAVEVNGQTGYILLQYLDLEEEP